MIYRNRRPSAPVPGSGHTSASPSVATSTTRVAKASDSHASGLGHGFSTSTLNSSVSATPQQKIVQVLVQRIKLKLPYNSGMDLIELESDTATQQAVEALFFFHGQLGHHCLRLSASFWRG
ncbi:hypothetical protein HMN09_01174900 [Mycena chlorophos]|uniref:Uncharacterized protein n=1 Tax=Mycena chlorophos TaxID=658473 RepID=A0A8H6VTX0_MYCCL|nr:hypothetical protein HMN09_01174900 [Mycena chlorophos]